MSWIQASICWGRKLEQFEAEFAAYQDAKFCIGVGNGLDALHLIEKAYEIGSGDEVIVPANTYMATFIALFLHGHERRTRGA